MAGADLGYKFDEGPGVRQVQAGRRLARVGVQVRAEFFSLPNNPTSTWWAASSTSQTSVAR